MTAEHGTTFCEGMYSKLIDSDSPCGDLNSPDVRERHVGKFCCSCRNSSYFACMAAHIHLTIRYCMHYTVWCIQYLMVRWMCAAMHAKYELFLQLNVYTFSHGCIFPPKHLEWKAGFHASPLTPLSSSFSFALLLVRACLDIFRNTNVCL